MVPETVQLMVLVAGLCSSAPALEVMRPAGIAPRRNAHRKRSYQCVRSSSEVSTSASARATRCQVSSTVASTGSPALVRRRYFLSQMSYEAGCSAMAAAPSRRSAGSLAVARTVLIGCLTSGLAGPFQKFSCGGRGRARDGAARVRV